jgi:hypothetical protein
MEDSLLNNTEYTAKAGDIICRTTVPDRIVFSKEDGLYTVKINNGRIEPLKLDSFDVVIGNIYDLVKNL